VLMERKLHITVTSLVAVVAPLTGKIIKNGLFLKEEKTSLPK